MTPMHPMYLVEVLEEVPRFTKEGENKHFQRETEGCFDFGDLLTVGKKVCVGGDETYVGMFLGRHLRFGFVVGVLTEAPQEVQDRGGVAFAKGEAFRTIDELHSRWVLL